MQVLERHELALVAGGKVASGGRLPTPAGAVTATGTATVSGSSNTTTTVAVVCNGKVTSEVFLWGAWQKTQCEPTPSDTAKEAPKSASSPSSSASGPGMSVDGQWKAYYWEDKGNG